MFWHIDTDMVSLVVIAAIYVYSVRSIAEGRGLLRKKSFLWCMRVGLIVTVIDIAASVGMEVPIPTFVYHLLMTLYLLSIELVILIWFFYSLTILYQDDARRRKRAVVLISGPYLLYAALALTNPWHGLFYTLGPGNDYARGPLFFLMVVIYALYAAALLVVVFARRRHIPEGYSGVVLAAMPLILALSIAVQLSNPGWLMILPGYMICLVLAFLFLQTRSLRDQQVLVRNLSRAAVTDQLTGLYNRAGMENEAQRALLSNKGRRAMVAVVDMDDLKSVNDALGHPEGDKAIQAMAECLKRHFGPGVTVARFGGDEFVIYRPGALSELETHRSLQTLLTKLSMIRVGPGEGLAIHGSIGAVFGVVGQSSFETLFARADTALYYVKRRGKNGYALFEPEMEREAETKQTNNTVSVS